MIQPHFSFEKSLWKKGFRFVVGVDEVGRGAFAGPLVVGAVIFPKKIVKIDGLNDSKLLKPRFRETLVKEIQQKALAWDVTEVGVKVINRQGIARATAKAMRKTIADLARKGYPPDFVLVDYFYIPYLQGLGLKNQKPLKHGDQRSFSIAAASVLAKVHRDKIMRALGRKPRYKSYGWGRNKGYGSKLHQKAILRYGLTQYHRTQYVSTWKAKKV
jgi:ribonuclease HII